jgi:pimeloyl-ACP methyl ester carboxylesterase
MWKFCASQFPNARYLSIPGHGIRSTVKCPDSMEEIAAILLKDIDANQPFQIIGHSMGGYLIPHLLHLGLLPIRIGIFHSKLGADDEEKKKQRQRAIDLVKENKSLYVRTMITHLFSDGFKVKRYQIIEQLISDANSVTAETIVACQKAMLSRSCGIQKTQENQIPVHYFAGAKDLGIPLAQIHTEIVQLNPYATLEIQEDIGHMGQWESPNDVKQWLNKYFID